MFFGVPVEGKGSSLRLVLQGSSYRSSKRVSKSHLVLLISSLTSNIISLWEHLFLSIDWRFQTGRKFLPQYPHLFVVYKIVPKRTHISKKGVILSGGPYINEWRVVWWGLVWVGQKIDGIILSVMNSLLIPHFVREWNYFIISLCSNFLSFSNPTVSYPHFLYQKLHIVI